MKSPITLYSVLSPNYIPTLYLEIRDSVFDDTSLHGHT